MICKCYYFRDIGCIYQPYVCDGCHDFSMTSQNSSDFFVVTIKNVDYRVYITGVDKKAAVSILKSSDLGNKVVFVILGPILVLLKSLKKVILVVLILETFILE